MYSCYNGHDIYGCVNDLSDDNLDYSPILTYTRNNI